MVNLPQTSYQLNPQKMQMQRGCKNVLRRHSKGTVFTVSHRLVGLNADGASVDLGIHNGLGALIKNDVLEVIHCFNHRVELAVKDTVKNDTCFNKTKEMVMRVCYLYQKLPKRLRELKCIAESYEKHVPKPSKSYGTRWIENKLTAMQATFDNNSAYMTHTESLSQTDSQPQKRAKWFLQTLNRCEHSNTYGYLFTRSCTSKMPKSYISSGYPKSSYSS